MKNLILISFLLSGYSVWSQPDGNLEDHPGQTHFDFHQPIADINYNYTKDEELKIKAKLESIYQFIQNNEVFSHPKGIEIYIDGKISFKSPLFSWLNAIPYNLYVDLHPWFREGGKIYNNCHGCSSYFNIYFNMPEYLYNGQASPAGPDVFDSDGSLINLEPNLILEKDGIKYYDNSTIVISKPEVPLYIPLTVRQYDNILFQHLEKMMKEKPEDMMVHKFFYEKLKEEMAQFSEEDLDKPAWQYAFGGSPEPMGEGVKRIVKINKAYFDPSESRTSAQLIIIVHDGLQNNPVNLFSTDEYSSFQKIKMVEAMNAFRFSGLINFIDR